jgi:hypothetical protein
MRSQTQLIEAIQRFQNSFWDKKAADRPSVGVYDDRIFLPIGFLRRPFRGSIVKPEDLTEGLAMTEYEYWFKDRAVTCDDLLAFSAPWRAIPWLEACAGCPVRYSDGSLAPDHFVESVEELALLPIPAANGWLECMERQTAWLESQVPSDGWVSPSILRGPSDVLAAMRGITNFLVDLIDNPQAVRQAAGRVNQLLLQALDAHFATVKPKLGGYSHIFGYWAPERTIAIQEDTMGMASPVVYRDIFMEYNAEVVRHLGAYVLFHLSAFPRGPEYSGHRRTANRDGDRRPHAARPVAGVPGDTGEVPVNPPGGRLRPVFARSSAETAAGRTLSDHFQPPDSLRSGVPAVHFRELELLSRVMVMARR